MSTRKRGQRERNINNIQRNKGPNFQNLLKYKNLHIQETQKTPTRIDKKDPQIKHILVKTLQVEDKEKILKVAREKTHQSQQKTSKIKS